ncbi:IreB family regulatory phosphoprotein [Granulicatella sp. zg-ZJ]|uniref:IreB family regulatory phosphoprotein n=1 Tax=unclassified Granulicatella TaxID=2630493 RepID=UPI0013C1047B|nr:MULTISPECIES: IreB family regulatory phosphoprotein [unclassified Granulicatella]MBS4750131.1 IreB family regulatory phosphoprotein [Carnobacteriaceae bacterium zg-ZUI78]NEW62334.1 IreB family regulatory phosphoprotein [Granulicatella sp. zg-ZJ]NEW65527.1 IreB family regulatory phosphoprotein [Granulicatella sp. zg-84]QMI85589.1 IreB family regulatory phosphoprotein [Carnobacteriaceae bacterium zg-84]
MEFVDETMLFNKEDFEGKELERAILCVYDALKEKGYQPVNQIVGYLMSGDPAYIPRHNNARNVIRHYERDEILEELLKAYLASHGREDK